MESRDERIALLRGVRFFTGAPEAALPTLADAFVPVYLAAGAPLFLKGEVGDSLYVITSGRVRVHDGELTFNELGPGHVVGEMAVLDAEPRSASVTALEETTLLCLRQEPLYALISSHVGVARGVIGVLCRHLRDRVSDLASDYAYLRQVRLIAAAAQAIEDGSYEPQHIAEVARRDDALGQLARVFQHMAGEVIARERRLEREVRELRIEIDRSRQQDQVAEITDSDYFRQLQQRAEALRATFGEDGD
ncbi:MAG: cyclic nucleotide-binding domain-containing protein [Chloroflexales bacterium]|nr:cyclic nucleotide-binding domain-containing protein [Chloroflexales bacterium]